MCQADAGAMRAALSEHDQVLQTAIESQDGFLFSHTGDGVVAAFASPRSAVDAAVKAQLALELPSEWVLRPGRLSFHGGSGEPLRAALHPTLAVASSASARQDGTRAVVTLAHGPRPHGYDSAQTQVRTSAGQLPK